MAAKKYTNKSERTSPIAGAALPPVPGTLNGLDPGTAKKDPYVTGNYLVVFRDTGRAAISGLQRMTKAVGLSSEDVASTADYHLGAMDLSNAMAANVKVFDKLGIAVLKGNSDTATKMASLAGNDSDIMMIVPERHYFLADEVPVPGQGEKDATLSEEYIQGQIDALEAMKRRMSRGRSASSAFAHASNIFANDAFASWGLRATKAFDARFTGTGIKVAILDSGIDMSHPDFAGRLNPANCVGFDSMLPNTNAQDVNGHGTHVAGTSCGNIVTVTGPSEGRRYGMAPDAEIFIGRIFPNAVDENILAAINWAVTQTCHVVNMSFETPVLSCSQPDPYTIIGRRALNAGTLLVAAAGNKSTVRSIGRIGTVASPANSAFIMAVGAVDSSLQIADFSPGSVCSGQNVDIVGPGISIFSSWPMSAGGYNTISGTSMACPHVTGLAALISEANNGARGLDLWKLVVAAANENNKSGSNPLSPARDYGFGLAVFG